MAEEVLLKSVTQAVPSYCMSIFLLPVSLCAELQKMMNSFWWGTKERGGQKMHWLKWEHMCTSKVNGGLSFRDLYCFNEAMLAKQGWRLLSDDSSLLARIYKARYYPNGSFLTANIGNNPSFTWRGILQTRHLLSEGLRWRIGNGKNISILNDPWIPRTGDFYVSPDVANVVGDLCVEALLTDSGDAWDFEMISGIFNEHDAQAILSIPLPLKSTDDKLLWHYDRKGRYTVKSTYHVAHSLLYGLSPTESGLAWSSLWKLRIPPKVKEFMWRALRNILPTKLRLQERRVPLNAMCRCGSANEDIDHALLHCNMASAVWATWPHTSFSSGVVFNELFTALVAAGNLQTVEEFCMLVWKIWRAHNQLLWRNKVVDATFVLAQALDFLHAWQDVNARSSVQFPLNQANPVITPTTGNELVEWSCYTDAAVFVEQRATGAAAILHSQQGDFLHAFTSCHEGLFAANIAEAVAVRTALQWIVTNQSGSGVLFTDAQALSRALSDSEWDDLSEFGLLVDECKALLHTRPDVQVCWIRRSSNRVAHRLARNLISFGPFMSFTFIPDCIRSFFE